MVLSFCKEASELNISDASQLSKIIFILADVIGWADLPMYGNTFDEAPNLEKSAREGVKLTNAYAAYPVCSPS